MKAKELKPRHRKILEVLLTRGMVRLPNCQVVFCFTRRTCSELLAQMAGTGVSAAEELESLRFVEQGDDLRAGHPPGWSLTSTGLAAAMMLTKNPIVKEARSAIRKRLNESNRNRG